MIDLSNPRVLSNFSSHIEMYREREVFTISWFDILKSAVRYYVNRFPKRKIKMLMRRIIK